MYMYIYARLLFFKLPSINKNEKKIKNRSVKVYSNNTRYNNILYIDERADATDRTQVGRDSTIGVILFTDCAIRKYA